MQDVNTTCKLNGKKNITLAQYIYTHIHTNEKQFHMKNGTCFKEKCLSKQPAFDKSAPVCTSRQWLDA